MYRVELYAQVRRSVFVEGLSEREAAKRFGLARGTVRKMLRYATPPGYRRRHKIIPVVTYAVERRIAAGKPDYWDHATLLELAVLGWDEAAAGEALANAAAVVREKWKPETTARNLRLIREARQRRREDLPWMIQIEDALAQMQPQHRAAGVGMGHPSG